LENGLSLLVGLTGGMGSGKSLAATFFQELGAYVIDADLICRKLVEPGQPAMKEISEKFGNDIFDKTGKLNRKKLSQLIFYDSKKKKYLKIFFIQKFLKLKNLTISLSVKKIQKQ